MDTWKAGDPAPGFSLKNQEGRTVKRSDLEGRKLLVYFYPKADTPGCTIQSCAVRDALPDLGRLSVAAVGISPDGIDALRAFDEKYGLGFPLLADEDHRVAEAYGVWREKSAYGRTSMGIERSAFLIGEDGRFEAAWYKVRPEDTVPNVTAALGG